MNIVFSASLASAKATTVSFGEKTWTVVPVVAAQIQNSSVRAQDLKKLSEHALLGKSLAYEAWVFAPETASQIETIQKETNQPVVNAELEIEDGWATTFVPHQNGQAVDLYKFASLLAQNPEQVTLPVLLSEPTIKLSDLNDLGINEHIATGESDFTGSTKNRIINIEVGASRYQGLILKPGEEFSFNKLLGEVDAEHGFKPEMVIKATGVTPEFGGGLCQVSSTMFRAAMNAGFKITARRNHSFAVHYYFPQGTDATIYPGVQDMKYVNDLGSHVAIRARLDVPNKKLYFDVYGTTDDRKVAFEGPVQYDKQANGALKATWTRHVTINGETTTQTFNSVYRPPALYQRSQTTVAATANPEAVATPANTQTPPPATN